MDDADVEEDRRRRWAAGASLGLTLTSSGAGAELLTARGDIDLYTAPVLREALLTIFQSQPPQHVVADLSEVPFIDSTGLGLLVGAHRRLRAGGGAMCLIVTPRTHRVLQVTGLTSIWQVEVRG